MAIGCSFHKGEANPRSHYNATERHRHGTVNAGIGQEDKPEHRGEPVAERDGA